MQTRTTKIYLLSQTILKSDNKQELLNHLPLNILHFIANQIPLQIFPDDTENTIINRTIEQQKNEYKVISHTTVESVFPLVDQYKTLEDKNEIEHIIEKNILLEKANLEIAKSFNERKTILEKYSHGFHLNLEGTTYHDKLSRIPLSLINQAIEINKTMPLLGINISYNKIQVFPDVFSQCQAIDFVNISDNQLKTLPESFTKFVNLEQLHLKNNQFQIFPEVICELKKISHLDMRRNPLQFIPEKINQLKNLKDFYLDYCDLQTLPRELTQLTQLETLSLNGNRFAMYTFPEELKPVLQHTRSYDGFGSNYNNLHHYFEQPGFSPKKDFIDEFKKFKAVELHKNSSITLNHLFALAKNICDKYALTSSHQTLQAEGLKHYKNGDYQSAIDIYTQLVDETKECDPPALYNLASAFIKLNKPEELKKARSYLVSACIISNNHPKYQKKLDECQKLIDRPVKKLEEQKIYCNSMLFSKAPEKKSSENPFDPYIEAFKLNIAKITNPLFRAILEKASLEAIQKILSENKSLVKSMDDEKNNALHIAAIFNRAELVAILCKHGIDINQRNQVGFMPLHLSIIAGSVEMMSEMLSHGADPTAPAPLVVPVLPQTPHRVKRNGI